MNLDWTILHWIRDTLVCTVGNRVITSLTKKGVLSDGR